MKENLLEITSRLNGLGEGIFKYIEKEYKDHTPVIGDNRQHLEYVIYREYPEYKVLFRNSHIVYITEDLEKARTKLREKLLSEILKHAVFGIRGVIDL